MRPVLTLHSTVTTVLLSTSATEQGSNTMSRKSAILPTISAQDRPTFDAMVRRVLATYRRATPAELSGGRDWYATAQNAAGEIYPERPDIAAGVIAALSPRAQWSVNLKWARAMVHAARNGLDCPAVHTRTMRAIAWSIATGERTYSDALNGPKTSRFARAIDPTVADLSAITVDAWAARTAEGKDSPSHNHNGAIAPNGRRYLAIERAYQRAGEILGVQPAIVQAVCWLREQTESRSRATLATGASLRSSGALAA